MKTTILLIALLALVAAPAAYAGGVDYKTVNEKVFAKDGRCNSCHGPDKDQPALSMKVLKRVLKGAGDMEVDDNSWYPTTYCDGPLDNAGKKIIKDWIKAGLPE